MRCLNELTPVFHISTIFSIILFFIPNNTIGQGTTTSGNLPKDYFVLNMCSSKTNSNDHSLIDDYCKCNKKVVNCDFSKSKFINLTTVELKASWTTDTVNRICVCGSPKNLQIVMGEPFIYDKRNISRVDLFKLQGPVIIDQAFSIFFAGDIYISQLKLIRSMFSWEYGRGYDSEYSKTKFDDLKDLKCCSEIKTPKFSSPTFYMENTKVNWIQQNAINNQHLWKNIIFDDVTVMEMDSYGIVLNGVDENASFTNCNFNNLSRTAIAINDVSNLLMAHNIFHPTCDKMSIGARSIGSKSVMAFIQNRFANVTIMEIDAKRIAIWFNSFDTWDSQTFEHINDTSHTGRIVSIEFNTVDHFKLSPYDFGELKAYDKIVFNENLISPCHCTLITETFLSSLPKIFQNYTQRCFTESGGKKELCHLKTKEVENECKNNQNLPDYTKLCVKSKDNFRSFAYSKSFQEIEPFLKKVAIDIESPFINDMLSHIKSPFQMPGNGIGKKDKSLRGNSNTSPTITHSLLKHLQLLLIFIFALNVIQ